MPNLRSQKRSSEDKEEEQDQTNVKMEINKANDDISQWVMIGPGIFQ